MRQVIVHIESSRAYGRGLLRGVAQYNRKHGPWALYFQPHGLEAPPPPWLRTWHGDGILARVCDHATAKVLLRTRKPVVDLRGDLPELNLPYVCADNRRVGELAAEHLIQLGLSHYAYFGLERGLQPCLDERQDSFVKYLQERNHPVETCVVSEAIDSWEREQERLGRWVTRLPKPIGVLACHDDLGLRLLEACSRVGAGVPEEVAVVGVDNDDIQCELARPPMSSIDVNPERVGYEAAALLARLMNGETPPAEPIRIPPRGVVSRASTDLLAVPDPHVALALRYIRRHACEGLRVGEMLAKVPVSQATLERRFREWLGRSPKAEMLRVQLERAKMLLMETNLSLSEIAVKTGFRDARYLCDVFTRKVGQAPGRFRAEHRGA